MSKSHPYIEIVKISSLIFFSLILITIFLALSVDHTIRYTPSLSVETVEKNMALPGKSYPRQ